MITVTITLTNAGLDTGNFSIFSNVDLITPLQTNVPRSSLVSGYPVANVPDAATSLKVVSDSPHCTNDITIPIQGITTSTTTTTTTTQACLQVRYGHDPSSPYDACNNYYAASSFYYYNGQALYDGPGCSGALAPSGYYSAGQYSYYWDSQNPQDGLTNASPCDTNRNIQVWTRINVPYIPGTPIQSIKVMYTLNYTSGQINWNNIDQAGPITNPRYDLFSEVIDAQGNPVPIVVPFGARLILVVVPSDWNEILGGINFAAATDINNVGCIGTVSNPHPPQFGSLGEYPYCYSPSTIPQLNTNCTNWGPGLTSYNEGLYNYGNVTKDDNIYIVLNAEINGTITSYRGCSN
jgi:hypothetical protein